MKPKALILSFKNTYINSNDDVFYSSLSNVFDLFFYGPGFQPLETLLLNSLEIYDRYGPFDVCFVHQYIIHSLESGRSFLEKLFFSQISHFNIKDFLQNCIEFGANYNSIPCIKFLMYLRADTYAFTSEAERLVENFQGFLLLPAPEVMAPLSEQCKIEEEKFSYPSTDRYIHFCAREKQRIISVPHIIAMKDFYFLPISKKKYLISVPGCLYYERKNVQNKLQEHGFNPLNQIILAKYVNRVMRYFKPSWDQSLNGIEFLKWSFKFLISRSRICYTDGSRLKVPVRKYFEIPAYSALLVADSFFNQHCFGFVEGENYVKGDSKNIIDIIEYSVANPEWTEKIIANSQKLIKNKFSNSAWSGYIKDIYELIINKNFYGANWSAGCLKYSLKNEKSGMEQRESKNTSKDLMEIYEK